MLTINKLRCDSAIDHAALEMKKYLRMMLPEAGDVKIAYDPEAKDGFRLGFLEDFGVPFTGEDPVQDDELYIETDVNGGILAGSNPRSVLFAVYRYLRENGCRWLYPGIDGDYVPMQDIVPVSYHKAADHRYRGFCDEGHSSQTNMLECIEYYAKLELNVFNLEFFNPIVYYNHYYNHEQNETHRMPEPVTEEQVDRMSKLFNVPALKVREDGYLSNLILRFPNECARHKLLDLIGDLRLCGGFLKAKVTAEKAGHGINTTAAKAVRQTL